MGLCSNFREMDSSEKGGADAGVKTLIMIPVSAHGIVSMEALGSA